MLVDDHAMVRQGLAFFLDTLDDMKLVGEAASGEEALRMCPLVNPDVVVLDLIMPGMGGLATLHAMRETYPNIQVVILTSSKDHELVRTALQGGAVGYLLKDSSIDELAAAIRAAYAGRTALSPSVTQMLIGGINQPSIEIFPLSDREREVLKLMVQGLTNRQIAQHLAIHYSTVKFHVSSILSKLNVASRTEAVALALQHRLVN
jgi:NarL family two-component system response regulator LiaR